ncbi:MAG: flagellar assembly protein T N-terminal domain-containing protein [Deferribacterales bacterium]|nr:flagellar assembly protein T N-terminal domain-containing protein [Deferribacterales bacterium]
MFKKIFVVFCLLFISSVASAEVVEALGEAEIVGNDIPSAKNMAISRAKFAALEQVSPTKINLDTIIVNAELADEAAKSELSAVVKNFKITDEGKDGNIHWVTIKAEIVPDDAMKVFNEFSKVTSIAVVIPAELVNGEILSEHPFSEAVKGELIEKGFDVADIPLDSKNAGIIANDVLKNNYNNLSKEISSDYMTSAVLVGKIKVVSKGNDVGYTKVNFSIVNGELTWRLIGDKNGKKTVIASGSATGRGMGATDEDAAYNLFKSMSKNASVKVVSAVSEKILGENAKTIRVALKGESNIRYFKELRDDVKNIPFVLNVKEQGINAVFVDYPEKTYYLASFLSNTGKYRVSRMDDSEIIVERR